jgi:hypothetical protein
VLNTNIYFHHPFSFPFHMQVPPRPRTVRLPNGGIAVRSPSPSYLIMAPPPHSFTVPPYVLAILEPQFILLHFLSFLLHHYDQ